MVHKKLSLARGELAHQFCQNLSFPLSMMQKFWLSWCDTALRHCSGVCRLGKAKTDKGNWDVSSQITLPWLRDGSELPGVCAGKRLWTSAEEMCTYSLCCVQCLCKLILSLSLSLLPTQVTDLQMHPSCPKYSWSSRKQGDISDYNIYLRADHPLVCVIFPLAISRYLL